MVSCCARSTILHGCLDLEVDAVRSVLRREAPIFGYYAAGEITPLLGHYDDAAAPRHQAAGAVVLSPVQSEPSAWQLLLELAPLVLR